MAADGRAAHHARIAHVRVTRLDDDWERSPERGGCCGALALGRPVIRHYWRALAAAAAVDEARIHAHVERRRIALPPPLTTLPATLQAEAFQQLGAPPSKPLCSGDHTPASAGDTLERLTLTSCADAAPLTLHPASYAGDPTSSYWHGSHSPPAALCRYI
eukprot:6678623-Prymnesium_polylepis.1